MRPNVFLDEYKIMPNHFHGIIMILNDLTVETNRVRLNKRINDNNSRDALSASQISSGDARRAKDKIISVETTRWVVSNRETSHRDVSTLKSGSLGAIIGQFKTKCTKRIHTLGYKKFRWQSRYHDRIIREEKELFNVRQYIMNNPIKWTFDEYYRDEN